MISKCSIKPINLRPLPWPATKPHHDPMMWGESVASIHRVEKPIPTFTAETVKSQTIAKALANDLISILGVVDDIEEALEEGLETPEAEEGEEC